MQLTAEKRDILGKKVAGLRAKGLIPAELYGNGSENKHLTVSQRDLLRLIKAEGPATLVDLVIDGTPQRVLIHDLQQSVHTDDIQHVDFYAVRKGEKIKVHVPVSFVGEAPAVKTDGAVLNKSLLEIEVEALPDDLPHEITVDLAPLTAIDMAIHIKDLVLPKGVHAHTDPETLVVSVAAPRVEEEAPAATTDVNEVKVEGEEKKAARDAKKGEEGEAAGGKDAKGGK
jgi:large subunit ribosomal protein L25